MDPTKLNYLAIVVATLSMFILGGLWYSPALFGKLWMRECGLTEEKLKQANMKKIYGLAFILSFIMAFNLAVFLSNSSDLVWGMTAGALAGIGWVAMAFGVNCLFERKSLTYFLINAGYFSIAFIIMGGIVAVWK